MNRWLWSWFTVCVFIFLACSYILYHAAPSDDAHYDRDSYGYTAIAEHFAQTSQLRSPENTGMPVQTVGYPLFVGILYKIFGIKTLPVVIAQMLLSIIAGLLIVSIGHLLFGSLTAFLAKFYRYIKKISNTSQQPI